jgi:hypothetical protein
MSDNVNAGEKKKDQELTEVVPTLYIALGGTGAEILFRIRRRILNNLWGPKGEPVRLERLDKFPYAEFLQIDLDANTVTESGKAAKTDILGAEVKFKEEERLVKKLDLNRYVRSDEDLDKYPIIKEWFPLSRKTLNDLNIDPEKGAGQIRSISRLYFFDKYQEIKSAIRNKCSTLLSNVSSDADQKRLGLKVQTGALKIVVVASTAGGTGSGSFLDLGYLAGWIGKEAANQGITTNLVLMLPTGYQGANLSKTEANTYAALMEMETCMRQGSRYINQWVKEEVPRDMPSTPYSDVYLVDTANLAGAKTADIKDLYDMISDALFEDFSTAEFANKKRSISVNQNQHKVIPYEPALTQEYGDMKLSFSRGYSSFGQATIDTHLDQKKNVVLFRQVNGMLKAFFGVASDDPKNNVPTEVERDEVISGRMYLGIDNELIDYDFVTDTEQYRKGAERTTYPLITELLRVNGISRLDDIEKGIEDAFESIRTSGNFKEWPTRIQDQIKQINQDTFKQVEAGTGIHEDAIRKRRVEILAELLNADRKDGLVKALWSRVDNKERGGLDYTIELIKRIKHRLDDANLGLAKALDENAKWFSDLSGHLRNEEVSKLQEHLNQATSKSGLSELINSGKTHAEEKLKQIAQATKLYVRYHLYAAASKEAALLSRQISDELGKQQGTDTDGNAIWGGFIGELEAGRNLVRHIIANAEDQIARTQEAMKQGHAMYFVLPAPKSKVDELEMLPVATARQWAEDAFSDFGGSQALFKELREDKGRSELLGKLRNRALKLIGDDAEDEENPLFAALDAHQNLGQLFGDFIMRAMPWVAAKVDGYLKPQDPQDQYKCFIGVMHAKKFEQKYGSLLKSRMPTVTMMTERQIGFVEIDAPGKVVCYTELSGIPLPSMKALDQWHVSYRSESEKIPLHTHRLTSTFVHAREMTTKELADRTDDLKLFVQAVALGVLTRTARGEDAGTYCFKMRGKTIAIGDEKRLRMNGFPDQHKAAIRDAVGSELDALASNDQLAMWVALLEYYVNSVYPLAKIRRDGVDVFMKSLPTLICERLVEEWSLRLERKAGRDSVQNLLEQARGKLTESTEEVLGSTTDPYPYEVNRDEFQNKLSLKRDVLQSGWMLGGPQPAVVPTAIVVPGAMPPPLAIPAYWVAVDGQPSGPHAEVTLRSLVASGKLVRESKVWKDGMAAWVPAAEVSDLAGLFVVPPPLGGMPPPL